MQPDNRLKWLLVQTRVLLLLLAALIPLALFIQTNDGNFKMPPKPTEIHVDSSILIIDVEVVPSPSGLLQYVLHYAINGTAQVTWFDEKEEVLIYLKYLGTLGYVDYGWNKLLEQGILE